MLPPEEEFIQPYSGIAPPVYGQEMTYDVPDGIELIDSHGPPWFHHLPLPTNAKVTLPPGTDPVCFVSLSLFTLLPFLALH